MKKLIVIFLLTFLLLYFSPQHIYSQVPPENRMKLGEISNLLPAKEMRSFYSKMEPLMLKIFGPPFSNISLKIEANPEGTMADTGFLDNEQTLILAGQAKEYLKNKSQNPKLAIEQIYASMLHELSHAQYYYGNKRVSFHPQWINEGWTKVSDTLLGAELAKTGKYIFTTGMVYPNIGVLPYFRLYLDSDTVAGTQNWGSSKQNTNHGIVYDITTLVHLTLLSAASSSNENLDFFKTLNNAVYEWVKTNDKTEISLTEYKEIIRPLLQGKTVDGQPAFDWYFSNPDSLINGSLGGHLGVTVEPGKIIAYAFRRISEEKEYKERPIQNQPITVYVNNYDGQRLVEKTVITDSEGNGRIPLPKIENKAVITIAATSRIDGKDFSAETFYFNAPAQKEKLYGVLTDENGRLLPAKYVGLLQAEDMVFDYKNKGVFELTVPLNQKTIIFDFLGFKQEIHKGPWVRVAAIKIPAKYIQKAAEQPESAFTSGLFGDSNVPQQVNNKNSLKNPVFLVGAAILALVSLATVIFLKNVPIRKQKK